MSGVFKTFTILASSLVDLICLSSESQASYSQYERPLINCVDETLLVLKRNNQASTDA